MAGVTPKDVYTALVNAGASTVQAIAIMANAINESGLNPEAVGDQGTSFGIVQQHGAQYAGLVTGNPAADLAAQVRVIALNGGFNAASGASPAQAAGNFAANYERCVGCQAGGAQYTSRVSNAASVAQWASSGNWPASAGSATASATSSPSGQGGADCAFSVGGQHIGLVFGHGPSLPSACLIRKTEVRALLGGMLLVAGGLIVLPGVIVLAAFAFRASGGQQAAQAALSTLGPYGRTASRVASAPGQRRQRRIQAAAKEQQVAGRAQRAEVRQGSTEARRAAGPPAQQQRAVRGQAPRRALPAARPRPPRAEHHE